MPTPQVLSYEQFGRAFIDLVITPDLIAQRLDAQLGAAIPVNQAVAAATVTGSATPSACRATRAPAAGDGTDEIVVVVPLHMSLHVSILDLLDEDYEVSASVELRLHIETWSPLNIVINADPVGPDDITLHITSTSWLKIAERLGGLEQQLKTAVCAEFNGRIEQGRSDRLIDVLARVRATLT
jgi:hypothetical protein